MKAPQITSMEDEDIERRRKDMDRSLANLMMLPYKNWWQLVICYTVIIACFLAIFNLTFISERDVLPVMTIIYYTTELLFVADTVIILINRNVQSLHKQMYQERHHIILVVISIISVMPVSEVYSMRQMLMWDHDEASTRRFRLYWHMTVLLRLPKVVVFYFKKRWEAGINQLAVIYTGNIIFFIMVSSTFGSLWYTINKDVNLRSWTSEVNYYQVTNSTSLVLHKFVVAYTTMANLFAHNWSGYLVSQDIYINVILLVAINIGFVYHVMIIFGLVTVTYINRQRKQIDFSRKINIIINFMRNENCAKQVLDKAKDYYKELWDKRAGVRYMPECFKLLPLSLQKEVTLDIFWDSFHHSHLFSNLDNALKRELSLIMKTEFLLPSDYLYRSGKCKMKMVYIVSGVIQVLADDDDDSPILSLSSGSLLGEFCCLYSIISTSNVRSATYCEIQTLYLSDFYRVLLTYRSRTKVLQASINHRVSKAKKLDKLLSDKILGQSYNIFGQSVHTPMRRLKKHWRLVYDLERKYAMKDHKHTVTDNDVRKTVDTLISSNYLDLIVLSNEIELKVQAICLTGKFPFVLEPDSQFRSFIEYICLTASILQYIILPYYIFFGVKVPATINYVLLILDFIYVIDVIVQASTAIKLKNHLIANWLSILIGRCKQFTFMVDVFSMIPYEMIAASVGVSKRYAIFFKLPRVLKIYKLIYLIKRKEKILANDMLYVRLLKYFIVFICTVYLATCVTVITFPDIMVAKSKTRVSPGLTAVYHMFSIYTMAGLVGRLSFNIYEILLQHIVTLISYFMYILCYAEVTALEILIGRTESLHKLAKAVLQKYMFVRNFPTEIFVSVINIINFRWNYSNNSDFLGEDCIIKDAPINVKNVIIQKKLVESLRKIPILDDMNPDIIKYVFKTARFFPFNPDAIVVNCNARPAYMYIILRGFCSIESAVPGDKERGLHMSVMKAGDSFPIVEVLHDVNTLIAVKTITAVEMLMLPVITFRRLIKSYPEEFTYMLKALECHELMYGSILHRLEHKVPLIRKTNLRSLGPGELFKYNPDETKYVRDEKKNRLNPYKQLGLFSMIHYFAFPRSINPNGTFFKTWESFRCIFAITHFVLIVLYMNILFYWRKEVDTALIVLNFTAYADLYIRMHCQFYNADGILVTHPLATAIYYTKNGFLLDFYAVLPFDYVSLHDMFDVSISNSVKVLFYLATRPFQLVRVFEFTYYMMKRCRSLSEGVVYCIRIIASTAVLVLVLSSVVQLFTCWHSTDTELICNMKGWFGETRFIFEFDNNSIMLSSFYSLVSLFTATSCGLFHGTLYIEIIFLIITLPIIAIVRWVIQAKLTSRLIETENYLTKSQNAIKSYLHFVHLESISGHVVDDLIEHYEHELKKDHNSRIDTISDILSPQLHEDIAFFDYGQALVEALILDGVDLSFIKYLSTMFTRKFVKKDSQIIRCNDVNDKLYFVWRGLVDITIANCRVATMGRGGMFGCLAKHGLMRQTIAATAKIHVELICIRSELFSELTERYSIIQTRINNWLATNVEYIAPKTRNSAIVNIRRRVSETAKYEETRVRKKNWYYYVNVIFNQESTFYKLFDYLLNVHLSCISCIIVITMQMMPHNTTYVYDVILLVLSGFFIIKIFLGFHLTYVDPDSGLTIINPKLISLRYLKREFFIDVISTLPLQFVPMYINQTSKLYLLLYMNYMLRFIFLLRYYNLRKHRLNVKNHLRWTYLAYIALIATQFMGLIWKLVACQYGCKYIQHDIIREDKDTYYTPILSYLFISNMFTTTGLMNVQPMNSVELIVSVVIMMFSFILVIVVSAGFASSFLVTSYAMSNYDHQIDSIKTYFNCQHLSHPILQKVWTYYLEMWHRESGQWTPTVIEDAPGCLKQNLLHELYGHHLSNHILFCTTHKDFLRQLIVYCKRCVYLPGYSIVEPGDVDATIYFVHRGDVEVIFSYVDEEIEHSNKVFVKAGSSFGEQQGLFSTPYIFTYKAFTVVDMITLTYKDWQHLLPWFPASQEEIMRKARELDLVPLTEVT